MIYLFTALYCEARIFIELYHLQKNTDNTRFQEFCNKENTVRLTVTGVGEIAAAAAVSSICTAHPPSRNDWLVNIGVCADTNSLSGENDKKGVCIDTKKISEEEETSGAAYGGLFLCNKLIQQTTGKTCYPDILYRHELREAAVTTVPVIQTRRNNTGLCDMESCAVYQAGNYFFGPHQMIFLKIVSDYADKESVSADKVYWLLARHKDTLQRFFTQLPGQRKEETAEASDRKEWLERLKQDMHCSKSMGDSLKQYLWYASLSGIDWRSFAEQMYRGHKLPCRDKKEGKLRFEEFKRIIC